MSSDTLLVQSIPVEVWRPSPNFDKRPAGTVIDTIILHSDASPNVASCIAWIQQREAGVSYHASFGVTGACYTHVKYEHRAWHALHFNRNTIGLNLSNPQNGHTPYTPQQLHNAAAYIAWVLMPRFPAITVAKITTHWLVDPKRKRDPYPNEPTFNLGSFKLLVEAYQRVVPA